MNMVMRHAFAIVVLPVTATILVPLWICRRYAIALRTPVNLADSIYVAIGGVFFIIGGALFISTLFLFALQGRGTLAPWDPPVQLVVRGPYRYVRNPMISGVLFIILGEALIFRSLPHAAWAGAFLLVNMIYIPTVEEPQLERRFGDEYRRYKRNVPRFVPRLRGWT